MSDELCECGHHAIEHGFCRCLFENERGEQCDCRKSYAEVEHSAPMSLREEKLTRERDEARAIARKYYREREYWKRWYYVALGDSKSEEKWADDYAMRAEVAKEWAIYWRKMYDVQLRQNVNLDCKVYIAEDERSEAARDLVDAENEIKRLRLLVMAKYCTPMIDDGFGNMDRSWCSECGGDMQVLRPGKFQCAECGK